MANSLQERCAELLLDHIRATGTRASRNMNMLEAIATPRVLVEYTLHLFERIEADTYPSIPMMQRVQGLSGALGTRPAAPARLAKATATAQTATGEESQ